MSPLRLFLLTVKREIRTGTGIAKEHMIGFEPLGSFFDCVEATEKFTCQSSLGISMSSTRARVSCGKTASCKFGSASSFLRSNALKDP